MVTQAVWKWWLKSSDMCKPLTLRIAVNKFKPLLHPIIRARTSWLQKKWANLQGTLKVHLRFYNRISRLQRPRNENWYAHYSLHARSMSTNASMPRGLLTRDLHTCILLASVVGSPHLVTLFPRAVRYTHVYLACI